MSTDCVFKKRFIGEVGKLISDILEISNVLNLRGYKVTVLTEKAFDSLRHSFLLTCLKKFEFGHDFIRWLTMLLESQESSTVNAGITTSYFILEKGERQGDPVSVCCFILCLVVLFLLVQANDKIRSLNIFHYTYLYTAYADDATFLKNKNSIKQLMETLSNFSQTLI